MGLSVGLAAVATLLTAAFVCASPVPSLGLGWDFAMLAGFCALLLLLALFILTGRPMTRLFYEGKFFIRLHEYAAYLMVAMVSLHAAACLWVEPLLWRDLLPPVSGVMQTALLGSVILIAMLVLSAPGPRRYLFGTATVFRRFHFAGGVSVLAAACLHAWLAAARFAGVWPLCALGLGAGLAVGWPIYARRGTRPHRTDQRRERNSAWLALPVTGATFGTVILVIAFGLAFLRWRGP